MKNSIILIAGIIMMTIGCRQSVDLNKEIPGTYSLVSQEVKQGENANSYKDLKQLKVYTPTHFMYTQINPSDSTAAFGVGSFSAEGDTLTEHVIYSASDSGFSDKPVSYKLAIKITPEGYNQIIKGIVIDNQSSTLTEIYNKVKDTAQAPFDGVWKEQASYLLNGSDTVWNKRIQFKTFFDGYFMFGSSSVNEMGKRTTNMGYGSFKTLKDKQFQETDLNSTYPFVAGNTFIIDYEMPDQDHYRQSIKNSDGSMSVEVYERVK